HERELQHEANSIRVAIKSELDSNKNAYELRITQFNEPTDYTNALIQTKLIDNIYKELIPKIGLLSQEEVEIIIDTYSLLSEVPYRIRILVGTDNVGGFNNEFMRVSEDRIDTVKILHIKVLPKIESAINALDKHHVSA
ncbi:MAG: hypothetical protein KZQ77_18355, partial [Candidatus Thiodiazotropha sp. (ex Notomyrtea botanica)]|nr:hypothetical protein [Candidatus Thiodiazotropha sp. (ex Notomyrtea botanica)]